MKRLKPITFLLCSSLAMSLILACSNAPEPETESNTEETKVEVGTEYNVPVGKQVYRMVTRTGNNSSEKTEVWYYDDKDSLVYYNEILNDGSSAESISYSDSSKEAIFGKEKHTQITDGNKLVDLYEDYDAKGAHTTSTVKISDSDTGTATTCEYDPNKADKNVIKYSVLKYNADGNDELLTEYYAKNLTWNASSRQISGTLLIEKKVMYRYGEETNVSTHSPLCIGYITEINEYDDTYSQSTELTLLHTTRTLTEYRWNQDLYIENPMEEISYNVKFDSEKDDYVPVSQSGYKVVQIADFEGQKKAIRESWLTSEGETQYRYEYDYDVDSVYELDPEYYDNRGEKPLYMTKKNFWQNSSKGLFLAESSEYLKYNGGDNNEYCYQVEIHKTYDNM